MGKATVSIPLVTLRPDGLGGFRPRYIPGARHRKLGFAGEDLKHPDGTWFTLDECAAWSAARQAQIDAIAAAETPRARRAVFNRAAGITVAELFDAWFKAPHMKGIALVEGKKQRQPLAASTVAYYRAGAARLEALDDGRIWTAPAAAVSAAVIGNEQNGVLHRIEVERGLHVVRCVRATLSACYGWGKVKGLVSHNPAIGLDYELPTAAPRIRYGSLPEMQQLIAAADLLELPEIGDCIMLGLWTGQRQGDRLALLDYQRTGDGIVFRQAKKHGQPLLVPEAPELGQRLERARSRRRDWRVNYPHVILNERSREPFTRYWYSHLFARVRDAAVRGIYVDGTLGPDLAVGTAAGAPRAEPQDRSVSASAWALPPMPSLSDFHDQDLRDTAVTWLALAECTVPMIGAITGHSMTTINEILKHYLGMHPELARSAIGKLVTWFDQQGETNG